MSRAYLMVLSRSMAMLYLLSLLITTCFAGNEVAIDSLLKQADDAKSAQVELFNSTLSLLKQSEPTFTPEQKAYYLYLEGYQSGYKGDIPTAINFYGAALNQAKNVDLIYRLHYSIANMYVMQRNWEQTFSQLTDALNIQQQVVSMDIKNQGLLVAALIYNQLGQYQSGLDYLLKINKDKQNSRTLCYLHQLEIEAKYKLDFITSTNVLIKQWADYCTAHQENLPSLFIQMYQAQMLLREKNYLEALVYIERLLPLVEKTRYDYLISEVYSTQSQVNFALSLWDSAVKNAQLTLQHAKSMEYTTPVVKAYQILYQVNESQQNYQAAFSYLQKYLEVEKGFSNEQSAKQLAYQRAKLEVLEKNYEIESLNQANSLLIIQEKLTQETAKNTRLFVYLMIAFTSSLVLWVYNLHKNQKRFKELAEKDGLTGLKNRRSFIESAENVISFCQLEQQPVCLIMFDLDKFKSINDQYGHPIGDWVLVKTAEAIKQQGRKYDITGRIGGEEFAIVLQSCDLKQGRLFAEQCRKAIESIDTSETNFKFQVSASFGVTISTISGYKYKQLMIDADLALYESKNNGRNRITIWHSTQI
ncbi:MAG: hypothetical protein COW84_10380 [Gammaproteobacteria bacterium CG22_combo_CG10-13_8_21_14_all_40_8]|nr:MAG: hypothetical protein COW84_10380 [Gammaproteobacteria bacterium CG22_combo_CG10-13_8_21_14_all_40_8]